MQVGLGNGWLHCYWIMRIMLTINFRMDDDAMGVFNTRQRATHATCILEGYIMARKRGGARSKRRHGIDPGSVFYGHIIIRNPPPYRCLVTLDLIQP